VQFWVRSVLVIATDCASLLADCSELSYLREQKLLDDGLVERLSSELQLAQQLLQLNHSELLTSQAQFSARETEWEIRIQDQVSEVYAWCVCSYESLCLIGLNKRTTHNLLK